MDSTVQQGRVKPPPARPCILCGIPTRNRGLFEPNNQTLFGATRITYPLCGLHRLCVATFNAVEERLLAATAGRRN